MSKTLTKRRIIRKISHYMYLPIKPIVRRFRIPMFLFHITKSMIIQSIEDCISHINTLEDYKTFRFITSPQNEYFIKMKEYSLSSYENNFMERSPFVNDVCLEYSLYVSIIRQFTDVACKTFKNISKQLENTVFAQWKRKILNNIINIQILLQKHTAIEFLS